MTNRGIPLIDDLDSVGIAEGTLGELMEAEETMASRALFPAITFGEDSANPIGIVVLVAMTVGAVIHDLAVIGFFLLVNLPKDDAARARASKAIAKNCAQHLRLSQDIVSNQRFAKG